MIGKGKAAAMGAKGGRASTPAKRAAARVNGLKGGRPCKYGFNQRRARQPSKPKHWAVTTTTRPIANENPSGAAGSGNPNPSIAAEYCQNPSSPSKEVQTPIE